MFFIDFGKESADIIHEAEPSDDVVEAWMDLFKNYAPSSGIDKPTNSTGVSGV